MTPIFKSISTLKIYLWCLIFSNIEPVQVYQRQSIDVRKIIINILNQPSVNVSYLKFTDLCPLRVTNRRSVAFVFIKCMSKYSVNYILINIITI